MMKRLRWLIIPGIVLIAVAVVMAATSSRAPSGSMIPDSSADYNTVLAAPTAPPQVYGADGYAARSQTTDVLKSEPMQQAQQNQPGDDQVTRRVVLKNAVLTIVVDDVDAKMQAISDLSSAYGGWIVSANTTRANVNGKNQVQSAYITIRVPANRLDDALAQIKMGVGTVEDENITGQDVTQDYVDLTSQLTNLQAAEKQLQEIMGSATKTQDVLDVYNQLVSVRGQIEQLQGRIRYYDEASTFASVQVTVMSTPIVQPVEIGGWRPLETARNAFQALINLLQGTVDVLITVAILGVPLLVVVGVPAWVVRRRRSARRTAANAA